MELKVDSREPVQGTVGSRAPSHPWTLSPAVHDDGQHVGPTRRQYSFLAECECPDDCLRDHENE